MKKISFAIWTDGNTEGGEGNGLVHGYRASSFSDLRGRDIAGGGGLGGRRELGGGEQMAAAAAAAAQSAHPALGSVLVTTAGVQGGYSGCCACDQRLTASVFCHFLTQNYYTLLCRYHFRTESSADMLSFKLLKQ